MPPVLAVMLYYGARKWYYDTIMPGLIAVGSVLLFAWKNCKARASKAN